MLHLFKMSSPRTLIKTIQSVQVFLAGWAAEFEEPIYPSRPTTRILAADHLLNIALG